jgi:hypothetical protein
MRVKYMVLWVALTCSTLACSSSPSPTAPSAAPPASSSATLVLEAEIASGEGDPMQRSAASGGVTVHLAPGQRREWLFKVLGPGSRYAVLVRYSNDETGESETLRATLDGAALGSFRAQDTGDDGAGWNTFVADRAGARDLTPGEHVLALESAGGDGCIEIDLVTLEPETRPAG